MIIVPPEVMSSIGRQVPEVGRPITERELQKRFLNIKREAIKEFLTHPISSEIAGGPTGSNTSGTLGGISNLFAFIGFEADDDPLKPILSLLESASLVYSGDSYMTNNYILNFPTAEEIFAVTPMPWAEGRSWAEGIERGISGLGYLIRKEDPQLRSGQAMQSSVKVRGGGFKNTPYISAFIKKYQKRLDNFS